MPESAKGRRSREKKEERQAGELKPREPKVYTVLPHFTANSHCCPSCPCSFCSYSSPTFSLGMALVL